MHDDGEVGMSARARKFDKRLARSLTRGTRRTRKRTTVEARKPTARVRRKSRLVATARPQDWERDYPYDPDEGPEAHSITVQCTETARPGLPGDDGRCWACSCGRGRVFEPRAVFLDWKRSHEMVVRHACSHLRALLLRQYLTPISAYAKRKDDWDTPWIDVTPFGEKLLAPIWAYFALVELK